MNNKRVLLIAPEFHSYYIEIIKSLESKNFQVSFYPEMPYSMPYRLMKSISQKAGKWLRTRYETRIINKLIINNDYDIVFIIRGCLLTSSFMRSVRKIMPPHAKFIMYQWDSMKQNNYKHLIKYFDYVFSFDMIDSKRYGLIYLPLFYTNNFNNISFVGREYDLVFCGSFHSDRLEIIKNIYNKMKDNDLIFKYHLYITKLALLRLLISGRASVKDLKFFKMHKVSFDEVAELYSKTSTVLDIELPIQNGLSMRTFETLGANLKLITTNNNIEKESFYNPKNIMTIDRNNIDIDVDFLKSTRVLEFDESFKDYHIDSWVEKIIYP